METSKLIKKYEDAKFACEEIENSITDMKLQLRYREADLRDAKQELDMIVNDLVQSKDPLVQKLLEILKER